MSGGIQLYVEAQAAGGISNISGAGVGRIFISAAAASLGGGAATAVTKFVTTATGRVGALAASGAAINTGATAAKSALVDGVSPTGAELRKSALIGAGTSIVGGVIGEAMASGGPAVQQLGRNAPAQVQRTVSEMNATTRSAYTSGQLNAAQTSRTLGEALGAGVEGAANMNDTKGPQVNCTSTERHGC